MPKTKKQKREEAIERQAAHDARTPEEQFALIFARPGASMKETMRLQPTEPAKVKRGRKKAAA
jgi:hypothetical protein